jgi:glutamate dehydrogenase
MNTRRMPDAAALVDAVAALARASAAGAEGDACERFVREYLRGVDREDLARRDPVDVVGAARAHRAFAARRAPDSALVRVFNPTGAVDGWQTRGTVVQIVNDDMPFLVDSVTMELARRGLALQFIAHPIFSVARDLGGELVSIAPVAMAPAGGRAESFIGLEIDRVADPAERETIAANLQRILADVRVVVADWRPMRERLETLTAQIVAHPPPLPADEVAEGIAFLRWLGAEHFTFVGYRCHDLIEQGGEDALASVPGSGLGVLRETPAERMSASFARLPRELRAAARRAELLVINKSNNRSTVHRPGYLDYVGVKRFDAEGAVIGEHRFLGLYTSTAYSDRPAQIPLLRRKAERILAAANLPPGGHAIKALAHIVDAWPRDELFQASVEELLEATTGALALAERPRFRLFVRRDPYGRFASCIVFAPRDHYNTELRLRWQGILAEAFGGHAAEFSVEFSESLLARVHIIVRMTPGEGREPGVYELEQRLVAAARRWDEDLRDALIARFGDTRGLELARSYGAAFPAAYREDFGAAAAVRDIEHLGALDSPDAVAVELYRPAGATASVLRFKLFHAGTAVPLSDSLPMLERMGFRVIEERPYSVQRREGAAMRLAWIHDFGLEWPGDAETIELDAVAPLFEEAFVGVLRGAVENDTFNRLVVAAALPAREIVILRACARYLQQIGFGLSQAFIAATLAAHAPVARQLVNLFKLRFDPEHADAEAEARQRDAIQTALDKVANLSEDRVLRQLLALIGAITRTNFWRTGAAGRPRDFLSFKLDPARVPGMPEPRPRFEIFVYSPRFEGVHLRGGPVARGGLRWSDRPEDFRTEVLGLVKAQMVKNAVIVPTGSKGGFVVKNPPPAADREATMRSGIACYQDYLRGLLDLTDNRVASAVVPPPQVRRHDGDDPYLVVAADKGTATFSDYANAVAREYGFWLDDAFASGGSAGYDHKAMGITARGAWESAKRHFRELGRDIHREDFTCVGIGDMSGDVFGNGMLLSRHIRLVAAFDHRHVFIDPDPDPETSFRERERLFAMPRSSWADYDTGVISRGGGVWPRSVKSVPISPEAQHVLGVASTAMTPAELIAAILRAPVDLIYNGGIGTYVKASSETHADVGDRANDGVRVNGRELRCRVVVEGGNLGLTQRGRIEYALSGRGGEGGRIYTDAIDNSAGVDTSDHEVNIKILLGLGIAAGGLTPEARDPLLAGMRDEVAALVLRDNYFQTQNLSVTGRIRRALLEPQARFIRFLEKAGRLDRALEFLPDDEEITTRAANRIGLTAPESAVLLAYAKLWLFDEVVASPLPDDPWVATALARYFPQALAERFADLLPRHPLRREIVATHVVNSMVNRVGATFAHQLSESTGATPAEIVRAYLLARESLGLVPVWREIETLDNVVADAVQADLIVRLGRGTIRATHWFLRSPRLRDDMAATIERFSFAVRALADDLAAPAGRDTGPEHDRQPAAWKEAGVPAPLARRVAHTEALHSAFDIADISDRAARDLHEVARVHFAVADRLGVEWLRHRIGQLAADGHWNALARTALREELSALHRGATARALAQSAPGDAIEATLERFEGAHAEGLPRTSRLLEELRSVPKADLAMLSVALAQLRVFA